MLNLPRELGTSMDLLVEELETGWKLEVGDSSSYSRKLVEFCSSKALIQLSKYRGKDMKWVI